MLINKNNCIKELYSHFVNSIIAKIVYFINVLCLRQSKKLTFYLIFLRNYQLNFVFLLTEKLIKTKSYEKIGFIWGV